MEGGLPFSLIEKGTPARSTSYRWRLFGKRALVMNGTAPGRPDKVKFVLSKVKSDVQKCLSVIVNKTILLLFFLSL